MPQFCIVFDANYTILATAIIRIIRSWPNGLPKYAPGPTHLPQQHFQNAFYTGPMFLPIFQEKKLLA